MIVTTILGKSGRPVTTMQKIPKLSSTKELSDGIGFIDKSLAGIFSLNYFKVPPPLTFPSKQKESLEPFYSKLTFRKTLTNFCF